MALELMIDSVDGLDEGIKGFYVEHEGKFKLDVSGIDDGSKTKAELERVLAKNEELLGEAKKAKNAKREIETKAQADAELKAREAGDHEQLYKSSQEKLNSTLDELQGLRNDASKEKCSGEALRIALMLADNVAGGAQNATILSREIEGRLRDTDEGVKVTDVNGNLTVSSSDDLMSEFKSNPAWSGVLKGNQSSGGGAAGGSTGSGAAKTMARTDFNALSTKDPIAASKFMKGGGQLTDN